MGGVCLRVGPWSLRYACVCEFLYTIRMMMIVKKNNRWMVLCIQNDE